MKSMVKFTLLTGCIFGAVLGIAMALSLDFMLSGGSPGSGWYEAVRHDIGSWFGEEYAIRKWIVYTGVVLVIAVIGIIGALLGTLAGLIIGKALDFMSRE